VSSNLRYKLQPLRRALGSFTSLNEMKLSMLSDGRGYFSLDELRPSARDALGVLVKDANVSASPCAS
jgi:hypothetical protein